MEIKSNRHGIVAIFLLLSVVWCAGEEGAGAVAVEVFGYEVAVAGRSVPELHRLAVQDALENAVLQTQVELDVQVNLDGMRIKDHRMHSRSRGYIESSRVLDSGFVQSTNTLAVYRVRMEVTVRPLLEKAGFSGRRRPAVALSVRSCQGEEHGIACLEVLASSLRACGIRVVDAKSDSSAYPVSVTLLQSSSNALWEIQWKMGHSLDNPAPVAQEYSQVPAQDLLSSAELDKLGVRMAQDALRLWSE